MPESADEVYARVTAETQAHGRLPMPDVGGWDIFPWEAADGRVVPRRLAPPADEPERWGETADKPCGICSGVDPDRAVWENERWVVTHEGRPTGLPLVLVLHTKEHLDFPDLGDELASEYGRISIWMTRIMEHLPHIGRVHVNRWGDGGSHFHVWFFARTARLPGILGSYAVEWDEILPPVPEEIWRSDVAQVARRLATHDGRALA